MKLSEYAKKIKVSYKTAWRYYVDGKLDAYKTSTGRIIVRDSEKQEEEVQSREMMGLASPQKAWVRQQASFEKVSEEEIVRRAVDWYMRTYPSKICEERVFRAEVLSDKASD
jgi:hypothetical protein